MNWPDVDDAFLEHHLPGSGATIRMTRNAIAAINSSYNLGLIRVVRLQGETGTGKSRLANVIAAHRQWVARGSNAEDIGPLLEYSQQFAEISLQALPDDLIESELFGHMKGAFTGAVKDKAGLLAGTAVDVLLDEIGDASPLLQSKLLGVLQSGEFRPLGATFEETRRTEARFIFATHRNLAAMTADGTFREDLFWRASEVVLEVPALRDQVENIPQIIEYQLASFRDRALYGTGGSRGDVPELTPADLDWATKFRWPGNIRQLRHGLVRWLALDGSVALASVVIDRETMEMLRISLTAGSNTGDASLVQRLDEARQTATPVAATLGELVDEARRERENALVAWHESVRPSGEQLEAMFPRMKRSSIVSKLSQWRNR